MHNVPLLLFFIPSLSHCLTIWGCSMQNWEAPALITRVAQPITSVIDDANFAMPQHTVDVCFYTAVDPCHWKTSIMKSHVNECRSKLIKWPRNRSNNQIMKIYQMGRWNSCWWAMPKTLSNKLTLVDMYDFEDVLLFWKR